MLSALVRGAIVVAVMLPSCDQHAVRVNYRIVDDYRFSWTERRTIQAVADSAPIDHWMRRHPDGRRWVGVKVGTYLADRAMETLGQTAPELVSTSTEELLIAAGYG